MRTRLTLLLLLIPIFSAPASAGTVTGIVRNGTTGKPAAGVDVVLLQLSSGMETLANTKTDSQGRYKLEAAAIGTQPMLIRAIYRGVNFHQPLPPGKDTADVEVFEPTTDPKAISVEGRYIVLQPNRDTLLVGEEFEIRNATDPPSAYYKNDGNFEFEIPEGAQLSQVSAWGPSRMPTVQGTMERGKNRYAIAYALHPGENGVRVTYALPYPGNRTDFTVQSPYPAAQASILAPPPVEVSSSGFQPAGKEQGMNQYARELIPANTALRISVSGTAPLPQDAPASQGGADSGVAVQAVPGRIDSLKWVFVGGFGALFALGAIFLWRRPVLGPLSATEVSTVPPEKGRGPRQRSQQNRVPPPRVSSPEAADDAVATVNRQVTHSLDELKDTLFRLELRRQAGTISETDYQRERSRAEKILRELVRG